MLALGLDLFWTVLDFLTAKDVQTTRLVSKAFAAAVPTEWTIQSAFVSDPELMLLKEQLQQPQYVHLPSNTFFPGAAKLRFLERLMIHYSAATGTVTLPAYRLLRDLSITFCKTIETLHVHPSAIYLSEVMLNGCYNLHTFTLPQTCRNLRELWIHGATLDAFELRPEWSQLRSIVLFRAGSIPELTIPETYVYLKQLYVTHCGLEKLTLLPKQFKRENQLDSSATIHVLIRLRELHPVLTFIQHSSLLDSDVHLSFNNENTMQLLSDE